MDRPACPICGAVDAGPPDPLGVHRCASCRIEFRPPRRMPIRRAGLTPLPAQISESKGAVAAVVIVCAMLGLAVGLGKHEAATRPPDFEPLSPPVALDPAILESLSQLGTFDGPLASNTLAHELHLSQVSKGELFATGFVHGDDVYGVDEIVVEASCRDLAGTLLASPRAVVSCRAMRPGDRCAWMIEAKLPGSIAEVEFEARGRRVVNLGLPTFDLRSDRQDSLELDPNQRILKFETSEVAITEPWATVTAYNPNGRVLGVAETRWAEPLEPGSHAFAVALPKPPDEVARFEVHVGGTRPLVPADPPPREHAL